ncbi:hypothetical protein KP79_PYT01353 [Mizuhopecten yessoensis]|uniref:Uncharacterized protein n=1 Tax=Mizuhopecten yessoensis TaxID=6573 RepID=A0A210QED4_MIZYE|nr:hypothetical protein KP79_PYT01353 [Mizuhopecten yessoensis]
MERDIDERPRRDGVRRPSIDWTDDPSNLPPGFPCELELFNAAMQRRGNVHFTCHFSGKVLITGIKTDRQLNGAYASLLELELYAS